MARVHFTWKISIRLLSIIFLGVGQGLAKSLCDVIKWECYTDSDVVQFMFFESIQAEFHVARMIDMWGFLTRYYFLFG